MRSLCFVALGLVMVGPAVQAQTYSGAASDVAPPAYQPPVAAIRCASSSTPHYDVVLDLEASADAPNIEISSPGQTHFSGHYLIQELVGQRGTRLQGLTWFEATPTPQVYVSVMLHTYDVTHDGWGSVLIDGHNYDLGCVGVLPGAG